jgi:hypothetical protein
VPWKAPIHRSDFDNDDMMWQMATEVAAASEPNGGLGRSSRQAEAGKRAYARAKGIRRWLRASTELAPSSLLEG